MVIAYLAMKQHDFSSLSNLSGVLAADCVGKIAGESCQVLCAAGFEGGPTQLGAQEVPLM